MAIFIDSSASDILTTSSNFDLSWGCPMLVWNKCLKNWLSGKTGWTINQPQIIFRKIKARKTFLNALIPETYYYKMQKLNILFQ